MSNIRQEIKDFVLKLQEKNGRLPKFYHKYVVTFLFLRVI